MALAVQLTQLERRLRDERLAADVKATQLEATIRRLEAQVAAEKQRRQSEQLRAIVEGMSCEALLEAGQLLSCCWTALRLAALHRQLGRQAG